MAVQVRRKALRGTAPAPHMTYEEFLAWADEDTLAEWVDGKVEFTSPASAKHQDVSGFLAAVMRAYAEERNAGRVVEAPFQMRLSNVKRGREPDIMFVAKTNLSRLKSTYLDGPADLAVEIVSPESALRDRGTKYAEYEAGGVREYWVIDHEQQRADFFTLSADERYERQRPDASGVYRCAVLPGFWIKTAWLWQEPAPFVRAVLNELDAQP